MPHAMARHNPGDMPSAHARTAPTPSEPNTPVMSGVAVAAPVPDGGYQQQPQPTAFHSVPLPGPAAAALASGGQPAAPAEQAAPGAPAAAGDGLEKPVQEDAAPPADQQTETEVQCLQKKSRRL